MPLWLWTIRSFLKHLVIFLRAIIQERGFLLLPLCQQGQTLLIILNKWHAISSVMRVNFFFLLSFRSLINFRLVLRYILTLINRVLCLFCLLYCFHHSFEIQVECIFYWSYFIGLIVVRCNEWLFFVGWSNTLTSLNKVLVNSPSFIHWEFFPCNGGFIADILYKFFLNFLLLNSLKI